VTRYEALLADTRTEFPRLRVVHKAGSHLQRVIGVFLRIVTLGGQSSYVERYRTVIGRTLYLPRNWDSLTDDDRWLALRHERIHLRQFRRLTLVGMSLLYFLPLPIGLAWFRARLEWEAYEDTIRATAELHGLEAATRLRPWIVARFTGPAYAWMWPFPGTIGRWFDRAVGDLVAG